MGIPMSRRAVHAASNLRKTGSRHAAAFPNGPGSSNRRSTPSGSGPWIPGCGVTPCRCGWNKGRDNKDLPLYSVD